MKPSEQIQILKNTALNRILKIYHDDYTGDRYDFVNSISTQQAWETETILDQLKVDIKRVKNAKKDKEA